ncbi:MAG: D-alanyl-D-alanine carboxypeptidase/D-alanyl-D-alanine-endopeptidase [Gemmatimonadaceae bacterium]|nr:D-alanyl-D-alanine carboxypeptidase/D-alanyl-D-alanine-endopeptidase [Gemmatimonadaceae bacterium]
MMRRPAAFPVLSIALVAVACVGPFRSAPTAPRRDTDRALARMTDSLIGAPMFANANWGILIVDPARGDTLVARNAAKLFMPASNQKLLTGATALAQLGRDFRWRTMLHGGGPIVDGVLRGDLIVVGRGDPSVSDAAYGDAMVPLRALADSLAARGVREVAGALVRGGDAFPDTTTGFGWPADGFDFAYSAGVDELTFNEGYATVVVRGGATVGAPVTVRTSPAAGIPTIGSVAVRTVARGERATRVEWESDVRGARPVLAVSGTVAVGDSAVIDVALRDPGAAWLDAFAQALAARGIRVRGNVIAAPTVPLPTSPPLVTWQSRTLAEVLPLFEKPSQNQIGELFIRTLGLEKGRAGTASAGRAVIEQQLNAWGADTMGRAVRDGSGLSRHDYVTPQTIVKVLDAMRQHPDFKTFYDALPIAGVDGTIRSRMRGTKAAGNVHAKTGTVDKVRSLSGYVTAADGRVLLFSMLCNNFTVPNREVERVQDALLVHLATGR